MALVDTVLTLEDETRFNGDVTGLVDPSAVGARLVFVPVKEHPALLRQVLSVALHFGDHLVIHGDLVGLVSSDPHAEGGPVDNRGLRLGLRLFRVKTETQIRVSLVIASSALELSQSEVVLSF